jgi:ribonucleoside-triphosphate reductase
LRNLGTFNDILTAQCVEIGLFPRTHDGRSGVQFCNLCEINGKPCDTPEAFYEACRAASIIGTMQAGYTDFAYLSPETREITEREALLGVSITGVMDNPDVLLSPKIQRAGAQVCKETNARVAKLLGINPAARITCTKPAGSTSCVLQTASGIHPHHARRYLRRVQANRLEFPLNHYKEVNPNAVEPSVWSANGTDDVISFACEVPKGAILKNDLDATVLLSKVKSSQVNWVLGGENPELAVSPGIHHNISNTVTVREDEWEKVSRYIYDNREYFTGISLLASSGDLDYPQAPFATVLTPEEIVKEYGEGSILASGLVVDGLHAFDDNLWNACDAALGSGAPIETINEPVEPIKPKGSMFMTNKAFTAALADYAIQLNIYYQDVYRYRQFKDKTDWVRRAKQFAERYFSGDVRKATYCLKHVSLWHTWLTIKRTHKEVDWTNVVEETESHVDANTLGAQACAGGACLL